MNRRKFLKFAGIFSAAETFFGKLSPAMAQTWQKLGPILTIYRARIPQKGLARRLPSLLAGDNHTVVLRSDGLVFTSGANSKGQLGDDTFTSKSTFIQALGVSNVVALACGSSASAHTMVLRSDGLVFGTGYNTWGQLADNTNATKRTFVQALGISNAIGIALGPQFSAAVRSDGLLFACGYNVQGQLGDNTVLSRTTFVQIAGISNVLAVSCGYTHSMILRTDGTVYGTGGNGFGQLGDNTNVGKSTYVQSIGISNAIAISCGGYHSIALRADGMVFTCGQASQGRLGDNNWSTNRSTFVQAIGISNATAIAGGYVHTLALRSDGLVFACGYNSKGQLGTGSTTNASTFVQSLGVSNAVAIAAGSVFSTAMRSDGTIFATGTNPYGQLGDNSTVSKSSFVQATGI